MLTASLRHKPEPPTSDTVRGGPTYAPASLLAPRAGEDGPRPGLDLRGVRIHHDAPPRSIQRLCGECAAKRTRGQEEVQAKEQPGQVPQVGPREEQRIAAMRGRGDALPASERAFFEPRFGIDFSRVRIHSDDQAGASARALGARAYTIGANIVLDSGQYSPGTQQGRALLAHELTHVVQQGQAGTAPTLQRDKEPGDAGAKQAPAFHVAIIEIGGNRLHQLAREAARMTVERELNTIAQGSKDKGVRAGFEASYRSRFTDQELQSLGPRDFPLYVLARRDAGSVDSLVRQHYPKMKDEARKKVVEAIVNQLSLEGGANVAWEGRSVSFVAADQFEGGMAVGPMSDEERDRTRKHVGKHLAELMLHELGHGMGAGHGEGLMSTPLEQSTDLDEPAKHFSDKSRRQILSTLEKR